MVNEDRNIEIDLIGNTGLRNPIRIHDGFQAFSQSANCQAKCNTFEK